MGSTNIQNMNIIFTNMLNYFNQSIVMDLFKRDFYETHESEKNWFFYESLIFKEYGKKDFVVISSDVRFKYCS